MRRVTIRAADVVAPVFAAPEVIPFLFAGMTGQARLGDFLRRLVLEGYYFCRVTLFKVSFPRSVTCFATRDFLFPTADLGERGVGGNGKGFELILVAVFAGFAADVIVIV